MATPIENNTEALQEILQIANALPEATEAPVFQDKTVSPTTEKQTVTPDPDYDGLSSVTVDPIPDSYVQPSGTLPIEENGTHNVRNYESVEVSVPERVPKMQSKSVTPSETEQTVSPDTGYDGLSSVSVGAISKTYVGSEVPVQQAQTIIPGTIDQTIPAGQYLAGALTIKGDANLAAENIAKDVYLFGIIGTHSAGGGLPDGVSAIDYGTYTPASDSTSRVYVQHKLGVKPDFVIVFVDGEVNAADYNGYSAAQWTLMQPNVEGGSPNTGFNYIRYSDGSFFSIMRNQIGTTQRPYVSVTEFGLQASSSAKLKAGDTHRWIVGKFA